MPAVIQPRQLLRQPMGLVSIDPRWASRDLRWLSSEANTGFTGPGGKLSSLVKAVDVLVQDSNAYFVPEITPHGIAGHNTAFSGNEALNYKGADGLLNGCTALTLVTAFVFLSTAYTGQWVNFRLDYQHTLDVFSQTSNSLTFGADWAGAWNGSDQQTITGLVTGQRIVLCAVLNASGARFFANGVLVGTKSGGTFTVSSAGSQTSIITATASPHLLSAAFGLALCDAEATSLTANPWQLFKAD